MRLLLVEDNMGDVALIRDLVQKANIPDKEIFHANDLGEGLGLLQGHAEIHEPIDLVFLDLSLPNNGGLDGLKVLNTKFPDVPVVILVKADAGDIAAEILHKGAEDYLVKGRLDVNQLIKTIRLAIERKQIELKLTKRSQELQALYDTSLEINAHTELGNLLNTIVERAAKLVGVHMCGIFLIQPPKNEIKLIAGYHLDSRYSGVILQMGEGVSGRVAQTGKPFFVADYKNWNEKAESYKDSNFRRTLGIPLKLDDKVIGVLSIFDDQRTGGFTEEEINLASMFADQAAIAVEKARLIEAIRKNARQMTLLNELTNLVVTSPYNQGMLIELAERLGSLMEADGVSIALVGHQDGAIKLAAATGIIVRNFPMSFDDTGHIQLLKTVIHSKNLLIINDIENAGDANIPDLIYLGARAVLVLPISSDDVQIGAILIGYAAPKWFTSEEILLGKQAASQIAFAISKSQSLEMERLRSAELARSRDVIAALSQVAGRLQTSDNPVQIMETIGAELKRIGVTILIALLEGDRRELILKYSSIGTHLLSASRGALANQTEGIQLLDLLWPIQKVVNNGEPYFVKRPFQEITKLFPSMPAQVIKEELNAIGLRNNSSILCLPLMVKSHISGVLTLWGKSLREEDRMAFLVFANQVAIALENSRLIGEIQRLAILDDLTGLYNRRGFFFLAEQNIKLAVRSRKWLQLMFADVDRLKQVNDTLGHKEGDQLLMIIAEILNKTFRRSDIVARMGGDEFAVLIIDSNFRDIDAIRSRIGAQIDEHNQNPGKKFDLSISLGFADWNPDQPGTLDELISRADALMYQDKKKKREAFEQQKNSP